MKLKKTRKHPLTLLEILLSLSLVSFLLFFFLGHLKTSVKLKASLAKAQAIVYERHFLHQRLGTLFSKIEKALVNFPDERESFFCTDEENPNTIHFIYDAGVDPEKTFSGAIRSKLFLTKDGTLKLEHQPLSLIHTGSREEILLRHVSSMSCEFYSMPTPHDKDESKISLGYDKHLHWLKTNKELPAILQLHLTYTPKQSLETQTLTFSFFINSKLKEIVYEG